MSAEAIKTRKEIILHLGRKRFGSPNEETKQSLEEITDVYRLDEILDRLFSAKTWREYIVYRNEGVCLFGFIRGLEESSMFQGLLQDGAALALRDLIYKSGTKRFGPATAETRVRIIQMRDPNDFERVVDRLFDATSWDELFAPAEKAP